MSEIHPCVAGPFGALGFRRVGTCHRDSIDHLFRTILDPLGTLLNRNSSKKFDTVNILKIENHMISLSIFFNHPSIFLSVRNRIDQKKKRVPGIEAAIAFKVKLLHRLCFAFRSWRD